MSKIWIGGFCGLLLYAAASCSTSSPEQDELPGQSGEPSDEPSGLVDYPAPNRATIAAFPAPMARENTRRVEQAELYIP